MQAVPPGSGEKVAGPSVGMEGVVCDRVAQLKQAALRSQPPFCIGVNGDCTLIVPLIRIGEHILALLPRTSPLFELAHFADWHSCLHRVLQL